MPTDPTLRDDTAQMVAWLRTTVNEDLRIAREAHDGKLHIVEASFPPLEDHLMRWHPPHVIADCEAKLAIIDRYEFVDNHGPAVDHTRALDMTTGASSALRDVLRLLAHAYRHREGWQDRWRP